MLDEFRYSKGGLETLALLKPDWIKLPRRLVAEVVDSADLQRVVRRVTAMAASQGTEVAAVGIETQDQARILQDLGVTYGQGFHWGAPTARPLPSGAKPRKR